MFVCVLCMCACVVNINWMSSNNWFLDMVNYNYNNDTCLQYSSVYICKHMTHFVCVCVCVCVYV